MFSEIEEQLKYVVENPSKVLSFLIIIGNCVLPRQSWRYDMALGKGFQKVIGKRFGYDLGYETKLILATVAQKHRKLDDKKMKQLSDILAIKFEEAVSLNESLGGLYIQFGKVKVNSSFSELSITWICNGKNDEDIKKALEKEKFSLRKTLSESVGANCPELKFVPDKSNLLIEEMNELFRKANSIV